MKPAITEATRVTPTSATLIDYIWIPHNTNEYFPFIIDTDISDHFPVCMVLGEHLGNSTHITFNENSYKLVTESTKRFLRDNLSQENWHDVLMCDDPEAVFNLFIDKLNYIYHSSIPSISKQVPYEPIRQRFKKPPWITPNVLESLELRNWFQRFAKYYPYNDYFKEQYKIHKTRCKRIVKAAKLSYYTKYFHSLKPEPKQFWQGVFKLINRKQKAGSIQRESLATASCNVYFDNINIADALNEHFATTGHSINSKFNSSPFSNLRSPRCAQKFKLSFISQAALKMIFKKLKGNMKGCLYSMPSSLLKSNFTHLHVPLIHCINVCIKHGVFPTILKLV